MNILKKINVKNISLMLSYLTISAYILFGNCLTFNFGNRLPLKTAEIVAFISCAILVIIHKKDVIKLNRNNLKIIAWFAIAIIPMFLYDYTIKQMVYGLLYPARIIATLAVTIVITNIFKKYQISSEKICKYFINNYLIIGLIGIVQLIFFPQAYDFYDIFYNIGVYFTDPDPHLERLLSTYFDPNFLAACLIIPTILALDFFSRTGKKRYFVETVFFITVIVLTVSRSGVAGLCISLFIYAVCTIRKKDGKIERSKFQKRAFGVMISTAIVFILLTFFTNVRVFKRILGTLEDESTYMRVSDWSNGVKMMGNNEQKKEDQSTNKTEKTRKTNPIFGIGYNMIGISEANENKGSASSFGNDSSLILIMITSGIVGSMYFAYMVGSRLLIGYFDRFRFKNNISMITIILTSLAICNFNNLLFYTLWLFPIFILLNLDKEEIEKKEKNEQTIIGIDARRLGQARAGIEIYVEEIIKQINKLKDNNKYILYSNKKLNLNMTLNDNIIIRDYNSRLIGSIWIRFALPRILRKDNVDVFWGTQHCLPERNEYTKDIKYVVTIHDLAIEKLKTVGSFGNTIIQKIVLKESLKSADKIIAISKATKNDIVDLYKIDESKINVIYNGTNIDSEYSLTEKEESEIKEKFKTKDTPYLLFLSTIEPRKNVETLIKAFNYVKEKKNTNLKLIIAGGFGWKYSQALKLYETSKYKEDIIMPGYISKQEKKYLYRYAECFVYPSLYEGFGLPILEAMSNETLVVTSNVSSIPEVGEDAVIYYNNVLDYEELGNKLLEAMNLSEDEKRNKIQKGLEQTKKFNWDKCAKELIEVLKK